MAGGRAETYDQRAEILGNILVRNRVVDGLRIIVPLVGVLAFAGLAVQIYLANLAAEYGVSGIRVDRGAVVVETPQYTGTSDSGSRYVVTAREARAQLNSTDEIFMVDATLELIRPTGAAFYAKAAEATMNTATDTVKAPGVVEISNSDGLEGTLNDVTSNSRDDIITSNGPVDLVMSDGTTIVAETMFHEGARQLWTFTRATVAVPDLPEEEE